MYALLLHWSDSVCLVFSISGRNCDWRQSRRQSRHRLQLHQKVYSLFRGEGAKNLKRDPIEAIAQLTVAVCFVLMLHNDNFPLLKKMAISGKFFSVNTQRHHLLPSLHGVHAPWLSMPASREPQWKDSPGQLHLTSLINSKCSLLWVKDAPKVLSLAHRCSW